MISINARNRADGGYLRPQGACNCGGYPELTGLAVVWVLRISKPWGAPLTTVASIPVSVPTNTGQSLPAPGTGEVVAARVVSQSADGTTQLSLGKGLQVEVRLPVTLAAGTNVALQVQAGGAQPKLALMVDGQGQPVTPDVARAALAASRNAGTDGATTGQAASVPRPAVQVPTFTPGDVLSAEVLGQTGGGATRLNVGRTMLDARLPEPLAEGTRTVALKVEAGGIQPRLAVVVDGDGRPASLEAVRTQAASGQLRTGPSFTATPSASAQTAGATSTQPDPAQALAALKTGDLVNAKVIRQAADGTTRLSLGRTQVEVRLPVALKEGATVSLRVAAGQSETGNSAGGASPGVRLGALIDPQNQPLSGDVARMANAARAQAPVQATPVSGPKVLPPAGSIVAAKVLPAASDGTPQIAIGKTVIKAPLGSLSEPGSNVLVKIASNGSATERPQISLLTNRQGAPVNGGTTNALASARQTMSGEVRLVRAPVQSAAKPTTPPEALDKAVNEARPLAASRQDSMAPLFANAAVASGKSSPLPQVLQQVVRDVLGFRLPADGVTGEQVRVAAGRSGLFNEAQTAAAKVASTKADSASGQIRPATAGPVPQAASAEPAKARAPVAAEAVALPDTLQALVNASLQGGGKADLKSTLFLLRAVLSGFLGDEADLRAAAARGNAAAAATRRRAAAGPATGAIRPSGRCRAQTDGTHALVGYGSRAFTHPAFADRVAAERTVRRNRGIGHTWARGAGGALDLRDPSHGIRRHGDGAVPDLPRRGRRRERLRSAGSGGVATSLRARSSRNRGGGKSRGAWRSGNDGDTLGAAPGCGRGASRRCG